jgi:hypothetical protein
MKKHRNQTVSTQFSSQREKPDQKILKKQTGKQKIYKILFDYQQKQLASNKVCHTLSSSQRTHTHQHHQPQQPANFSEPCSILEFVTLSGATPPAYQSRFPLRKSRLFGSGDHGRLDPAYDRRVQDSRVTDSQARPVSLDSGAVALGDASTKLHRR